MDAKKCDKCGVFYTENKTSLHGRYICGIRFEHSSGNLSDRTDLCDECLVKLKEFLGRDSK